MQEDTTTKQQTTIHFIRHETTHGPYFSSKQKAIEYLQQDKEWWEENKEEILADTSPYCTIVEVILDDDTVILD